MTKEQRETLQDALRMLGRARRSADCINPNSYGYLVERDLVGPPTPVPVEFAIGYVAGTLERLAGLTHQPTGES